MTTIAWTQSPEFMALYSDALNWGGSVPGVADAAEFEASSATNITIDDARSVAQWVFNPGATQYNFDIAATGSLDFEGSGITINAGSVHIINFGELFFRGTAGGALIDDFGEIDFGSSSSAGAATIHTFGGGALSGIIGASVVNFWGNSTGGSAQFITDAGGVVDFSRSLGPDRLGHITAGSIAGAGTYLLGGDQLTVGLNGLSTEVSGPIEDGGAYGGIFASLVKVGPGTLKLSHAGNTYSFGTFLEAGKLDLAAVGAAGPDPITFSGPATLAIENAALLGQVFGNAIDSFARHDVLDLVGLSFHKGATAKYHPATDILDVHSGGVTDVFKLVSPLGTHFVAAKDGQGGTKVTLDPPHHTVASLSTHDVAEQHWATDTAGRAGHLSDFLLTA